MLNFVKIILRAKLNVTRNKEKIPNFTKFINLFFYKLTIFHQNLKQFVNNFSK